MIDWEDPGKNDFAVAEEVTLAGNHERRPDIKRCEKRRLLELIHDFVLFDNGVKKLPRAHQYAGIKAAQRHVREKKGGIIWHTQGSGKSIVMVLLAKWILENNPNARVAIITDRPLPAASASSSPGTADHRHP